MAGCRNLSEQEVARVRAALTCLRDTVLWVLGCKSGYRISELLSIKVNQIYERGEINQHVAIPKDSMKGGIRRSVALHAETRQLLKLYLTQQKLQPTDWLFQNPKKPYQHMTRFQVLGLLKEAYAVARIEGKTGTHTMRKVYAHRIWDLLGRTDILMLANALGHVPGYGVNNAEKYIDINQDEIDRLTRLV